MGRRGCRCGCHRVGPLKDDRKALRAFVKGCKGLLSGDNVSGKELNQSSTAAILVVVFGCSDWRLLKVLEIATGELSSRRVHLSTGQPYGAGPRAAEASPKRTPKDPLGIVPESSPSVLALGYLRGQFRQL